MLSKQHGEAAQLIQQESLLGTLLEVLSQDKSSSSQQSIIRQALVVWSVAVQSTQLPCTHSPSIQLCNDYPCVLTSCTQKNIYPWWPGPHPTPNRKDAIITRQKGTTPIENSCCRQQMRALYFSPQTPLSDHYTTISLVYIIIIISLYIQIIRQHFNKWFCYLIYCFIAWNYTYIYRGWDKCQYELRHGRFFPKYNSGWHSLCFFSLRRYSLWWTLGLHLHQFPPLGKLWSLTWRCLSLPWTFQQKL